MQTSPKYINTSLIHRSSLITATFKRFNFHSFQINILTPMFPKQP